MKKFSIIALAALLVVAFSMPAAAVENIFGGYWRTRAYTDSNFTGEDETGEKDVTQVDTRTRLYYTAKFSDDFKFVNKFEFDQVWGDTVGGDIGADGKGILEVKNSYADFNLSSFNFKVGAQGMEIARGFFFSDDFSGIQATYKGDGISVPVFWVKAYEGGAGDEANDMDVDYYGVSPSFTVGDGISLNPFIVYITSQDESAWGKIEDKVEGMFPGVTVPAIEELSLTYIGINADLNLDPASIWFTGIYETGTIDFANGDDVDVTAYLAAVGASMGLGAADLHAQVFYASGTDLDDADDVETFFVPKGQSYYWSEIMGYGIFDNDVSNGSPADQIGNIMAANIGATFKPMDDLKLTADLWYAQLVEDDVNGNTDLGTEIDFKATYKLMDNLNLDAVIAYLMAGDSTTMESDDDANVTEAGLRLSLSF